MADTYLKTDSCSYNQSAAPYAWISDPVQFGARNQAVIGELGVSVSGGNVRPADISVSSFLSGRDSVSTRCIPPSAQPSVQPATSPIETRPVMRQFTDPQGSPISLSSGYTREKKSTFDLSYNAPGLWQQETLINFQDPRYIIESVAEQRGGLNTNSLAKSEWTKRSGALRR